MPIFFVTEPLQRKSIVTFPRKFLKYFPALHKPVKQYWSTRFQKVIFILTFSLLKEDAIRDRNNVESGNVSHRTIMAICPYIGCSVTRMSRPQKTITSKNFN